MSEPEQPYGPPPGFGTSSGSVPSALSGSTWGPPPPGVGAPGYGPVDGPGGGGPTQTETKAIVALVLAVLTWTPIVPFVGAVVALVLARLARRDILASGGRLTGLGLVKAARILSIVHLVFVALAVVLVVVLLTVPFSFS